MTDIRVKDYVEVWLDRAVGLTFFVAALRGASEGAALASRLIEAGSRADEANHLAHTAVRSYLDRLVAARDQA